MSRCCSETGDGTFGAASDYGTVGSSQSVAIADLNADGRPDLAVAANGYYPVSVLLGNGDGTFAAKTDYGSGTELTFYGLSSVAIADLNADGRSDLAVTTNINTVAVLLGNGDGTFGAWTEFGTGITPSSVAIADLNADGRRDLAVANYGSRTVSVLLNRGGTVGVGYRGPAALALAIRGAIPNPAAGGRLWVEFALRDGSPARLELMDVAGRVLTSKQVGTLGPGAHALDLSEGGAPRPGIYFLRLTQGESEVRARATVLR